MKYTFTVEVDTDTFLDADDIIGAKEQIAMALDGVGQVKFTVLRIGGSDSNGEEQLSWSGQASSGYERPAGQ